MLAFNFTVISRPALGLDSSFTPPHPRRARLIHDCPNIRRATSNHEEVLVFMNIHEHNLSTKWRLDS